ncbi:MAG: pentapeptide repeat-containing protein [Chloroflexi bacterium]|nr:pentapeptide repeat-containing protein [Chloroflexota bacterium]
MLGWFSRKIKTQVAARMSREALLARAVHSDNITALAAIEELKERLHFQDGSMQGHNLAGARLQNVRLAKALMQLIDLTGADLRGAYFGETDLVKARLIKADLSDSNLREIRLTDADLTGAKLRGAHMAGADLRGALLRSADLTGANLWQAACQATDLTGADLTGANLTGVRFNSHTILPDGQLWSHEIDLTIYTGRRVEAD